MFAKEIPGTLIILFGITTMLLSASGREVKEIKELQELQSEFEAASGKVRMVTLLSPT